MKIKPRTATEIELAKEKQEKTYEGVCNLAKLIIEPNKEDNDCPSEHWLFGGEE